MDTAKLKRRGRESFRHCVNQNFGFFDPNVLAYDCRTAEAALRIVFVYLYVAQSLLTPKQQKVRKKLKLL